MTTKRSKNWKDKRLSINVQVVICLALCASRTYIRKRPVVMYLSACVYVVYLGQQVKQVLRIPKCSTRDNGDKLVYKWALYVIHCLSVIRSLRKRLTFFENLLQ